MHRVLGMTLLTMSATAVAFDATRVAAPELDPASVLAVLTLLTGDLAVRRGRRGPR